MLFSLWYVHLFHTATSIYYKSCCASYPKLYPKGSQPGTHGTAIKLLLLIPTSTYFQILAIIFLNFYSEMPPFPSLYPCTLRYQCKFKKMYCIKKQQPLIQRFLYFNVFYSLCRYLSKPHAPLPPSFKVVTSFDYTKLLAYILNVMIYRFHD